MKNIGESGPNPYEVGDETDVVIPVTSQLPHFEFIATDPHGSEWKVCGYDDRVQFQNGFQTHELRRDTPKLHSRFFDQAGLECILIVDVPEPLGFKFTDEDFLTLRKWAGAVRQSDLDREIDNFVWNHVIRIACCSWALWGDIVAGRSLSAWMCVVLILLVLVDAVIGRIWRKPLVFRLYAGWWALVGVDSMRRIVMEGIGIWVGMLAILGWIACAIHMQNYRQYKDVAPDDQLHGA
ncbi:MAG: hypothetical protein AB8G99_17150 [Planctomycetaceae bacterium]